MNPVIISPNGHDRWHVNPDSKGVSIYDALYKECLYIPRNVVAEVAAILAAVAKEDGK